MTGGNDETQTDRKRMKELQRALAELEKCPLAHPLARAGRISTPLSPRTSPARLQGRGRAVLRVRPCRPRQPAPARLQRRLRLLRAGGGNPRISRLGLPALRSRLPDAAIAAQRMTLWRGLPARARRWKAAPAGHHRRRFDPARSAVVGNGGEKLLGRARRMRSISTRSRNGSNPTVFCAPRR